MRKLLSAIFVLFTLCFSSYALADIEKVFTQEMVAVMRLVQKDAAFWPGFSINSKPIVLGVCHYVDDQEIEKTCGLYAFNFKPTSNNWKKLTVDKQDVYYSPNDAYGVVDQDTNYYQYEDMPVKLLNNPYTIIDGQPCYVQTFFISNYASGDYLLRETMNILGGRLQAHMLVDAPNAVARKKQTFNRLHASYEGFKQTANVALLYTETQLMKSYIKKPNEETLKNFVAIENVRKANATEQMLHYEYNDLSSYFIYPYAKLTNLAGELLNNGFYFEKLDDQRLSDTYFSMFDYTKRMIAYISMASIVALENTDASWKTTMNSQLVSAQELLMEHYKMSPEEINRRVNTAKLTYDYDALKKRLDEKLQPGFTQLDVQLKKYQDTPGVVTHLVLPASQYVGYYGNNIIDSETTLIISPEGSGYSVGQPTIFGYSNLKYIKSRTDAEKDVRVHEFKIPSNSTITIDGVTQTVASLLAAKQKVSFTHMETKEPSTRYPVSITVGSEKSGTIDASNGSTLEITR